MEDFGFNKPVQRTEDPRLLRGAGRYIDDVDLPRQAHGTMLRSPHAHARIRAIDVAEAREAPGVLLVLTGADYVAAGLGPMPQIVLPVPGFDPKRVFPAMHWPLATDRARYLGDGIAFIVAETRAQAVDAAELIEVDYEPLPAVTDPGRAAEPGAPRVWEDCKRNAAFEFSQGNAGAVDEAFSRAAHVVRRRLRINRLSANPIESRGVVADYDAAADFFTVYLGTQDAFRARAQIANDLLKLPEDKFRVVAGDVGGSFGMKGALYPETPLAVWASRRIARPVKWVSDRSEAFMSDSHARDKWIDAELALDHDYRFLAMRVQALANVGAYYSTLATFPIILSTSGIAGSYATPAIHYRAIGVFTNTNPTTPYRGSGRPDAAFIAERLIDFAARELGVAPDEIRRRNTIPKESMPYQTPLGARYDSGDFPANREIALERADYAGFAARRKVSAASGRLRGIGIGANVEGSAPPGEEQARIEIDAAGNATVWVGSTDQGQGHATLYTQIACEQLGLSPDRVRVTEGDTGTLAQGFGTGGSRVSALGALAVYEATRRLLAQGEKIAAQALEADEHDIEFSGGRFRVCGTDRSMTLGEVAREANDKLPRGVEPGFSATGSHKTSLPTWPSGCHVCELEIDPETGRVEIVRYVAVTDLGRAINPLQANGQIHGGIVQALGQALCENIAYDAGSGQLLSGSFMDYAMPRADSVCAIECYDNPVPTAINPLGVKGAGEVGAGCAVPAFMNAVADALSPLGINHLDMPCTPERVWRAIRAAAARTGIVSAPRREAQMKSWWIRTEAGATVLEAREAAVPEPKAGEVLVRLRAASLNRGEFIAGHGLHASASEARPAGGEGAGEIAKLGERVAGLEPGERVMGRCRGAFAEYAVMDAREALAVPPRLSWEEAASVPLVFMVVHDMLIAQGGLARGEWLLVTGASSGVGVAALQTAKLLGAKVIGTSGSQEKLARLAALGLDAGVCTGRGNSAGNFLDAVMAATGGRGADLVVNNVGGTVFAECVRSLAFEGRLATVGYVDGVMKSEIDLEALHAKRLRLFGVSNKLRNAEQRAATVRGFAADLLPAIADGRIRPVIDRVFAFAELPAAKAYMESNAQLGKIAIGIA